MEGTPGPGQVAIGRVAGAAGVRGAIKVEPLGPDSSLAPNRTVEIAGKPLIITGARKAGRLLYLSLTGIEDREAAEALRDHYILTSEDQLEPLAEDQYYHFQLIGLAVRSSEGEDLGEVKSILSTPGNDVFVVQGPMGEILVPAVDDVIRRVDLENGEIIIDVVPGLLPEPPKR